MKKIVAALFIISMYGCAVLKTNKPNNEVDVYLVAGQSNATGQGYVRNLPADFVINDEVLIFHSGAPALNSGKEPFKWYPLMPASESPDRFGPELSFGSRLQEMYPGRKIAIIKHGKTDTDLFAQWKPGESKSDTSNWGPEYKLFVLTVESGLDSLRKSGFNPIIRGMAWQQGEADSDHEYGVYSGDYAKNLKQFILRVREQFNVPNMRFVYGYVYPLRGNKLTHAREKVRNAQIAVDANSGSEWSVPNAFLIETDDLPHRADELPARFSYDHIHFSSKGMILLGQRMADRLAE
jgi:lysophospholipase L1-like esterase